MVCVCVCVGGGHSWYIMSHSSMSHTHTHYTTHLNLNFVRRAKPLIEQKPHPFFTFAHPWEFLLTSVSDEVHSSDVIVRQERVK